VPVPASIPLEQPRDRRSSGAGAAHVLVVDEERRIGRGLEIILRSAGYAVEAAASWFDVLARVIASPPDALLLDLVLPEGRGVELCREVRRVSGVPIVVLSAVGDERQRIRALDTGADDFVITPFCVDELLARLRGVLRQPGELGDSTRFEIGELVVDVAERRVARAGEEVPLTPVEFELVRMLARHRGRLVTDRQLLRALWGSECPRETRELRVLVAEVRTKLERDPSRPEYLITEPGVGYRLARKAVR
jgi:two-component system KDP operon response regulator KdpE